MNKFWNWTKNEETGERTLRLDGMIIDEDWLADFFGGKTAKKFREELNSGEGDISVWINSEGGDCQAGAQIYNMLKDYKGKVTIKIDAVALSAASVVAMAGDVIEISPVGLIMIHNPWTWSEGDAAEMKTVAKMLDEVKESIINAYELKTHLPRTKLSKMMDDETWMHAHNAVELGFADKIIGDAQAATETDISSRQQVLNCMRNSLRRDNRVNAEQFRRRLKLIP